MTNYLEMLEESLKKKIALLDQISEYNKEQEKILHEENVSIKELDANMDQKEVLAQKVIELDDGFDSLYTRIKDQLIREKDQYASQIKRIQGLISQVMDKSVSIQAQETRNKSLLDQYFIQQRRGIQKKKKTTKAAYDYYKSMSGYGASHIQMMDQKK